MNYLLDTHLFLWYINGDEKLKSKYKEIIENLENDMYLSTVSIWECIIKAKTGKLEIPNPIYDYLNTKRIEHKIEILNFNYNSLYFLETLPDIHKDPFDRLIICQALSNNLILLTDDELILKYPVQKITN